MDCNIQALPEYPARRRMEFRLKTAASNCQPHCPTNSGMAAAQSCELISLALRLSFSLSLLLLVLFPWRALQCPSP